jgi:hypothetical protein
MPVLKGKYCMAAEELKDCPCCGSLFVVNESYYAEIGHPIKTGRVICKNCGLNMETCSGETAAIKRWNRRSDKQQLRQAIAKLPFYIERRGGLNIRVDNVGGCGSATSAESEMWKILQQACV